jgi:hypothetical protein
MTSERIDQALARLEAALARAEAAVATLADAAHGGAETPGLRERHQHLQQAVAGSLRQLDEILAGMAP